MVYVYVACVMCVQVCGLCVVCARVYLEFQLLLQLSPSVKELPQTTMKKKEKDRNIKRDRAERDEIPKT